MMTAEIIIMNKEAVALAADSASTATIGRKKKIFTSVNKIFALSKYHPVGIMIYGKSSYMGIPWETIIKLYQKKITNLSYNSIKEYASNFLSFLEKEKQFYPNKETQEDLLKNITYFRFFMIKENINNKVKKHIKEKGVISISEAKKIANKIIDDHLASLKGSRQLFPITDKYRNSFIEKYSKIINKAKKTVFEKLLINNKNTSKLIEIIMNLCSKESDFIRTLDYSGIVIAGFGDKELFPAYKSFTIEGIVNDKLIYQKYSEDAVDVNNSAVIRPFAQQEMVYAFMEGIDPGYDRLIHKYMYDICNEYPKIILDKIGKLSEAEKTKIHKKLLKISESKFEESIQKLKRHRRIKYINPIINAVQILPKDELAGMAESLVNLTSFKKKVTIEEEETVGGPIDVAIISKGDGLIWIKRKQYFNPEINRQFFSNYFLEGKNGKKQKK